MSTVQAVPYLGNADFQTRDAVKGAIASIVGIRVPETRVPRGESLLPIGEEKLRSLRAEYAALPTLAQGLDAYHARLEAEKPVDSAIEIQRVRMSTDIGGLYGEGKSPKNALAYSRAGFSQVAQFVKPTAVRNGFSENLLAMPVAMRAQWFNHCAENSLRDRNEKVVIRTLMQEDRRIVRAVTSERHSLETGDDRQVVQALRRLDGALKGAKVRITRHGLGDATWLEILYPAVDRQIRVGDSLAFGLRFRNSETKAGCLIVEPFIFDAICYNLTTAYSELEDEAEFTLRHVGDLSRRLPALIAKAQRTIDPFVRMFGDAYKTALPAFASTRGEVLSRIGKAFELPETSLTLAAQLWDADGSASAGDTLAGAANALTRASQEAPMSLADDIERVAGRLIAKGWEALA